ncbi:WecB/TagA/CpsF family glycosyltransferase [Pseudonocardia alni]|uniref:WecB/TagA/CpsF family glycosyltransferase n=1 Tax=Pseudonocardia alni TaxID=33907 RepID=UPI0027A25E97|nr:WecB/TagA/CpsF family glycosyltransferase [Pseudonocardia alni]
MPDIRPHSTIERIERIRLRNVHLDRLSLPEAVRVLHDRATAGAGGIVLTPNVAIAREFDRADYRWLSGHVVMWLLDGVPLRWIARAQGDGHLDRVAGSDLLRAVVREGWTDVAVCVLGAGASRTVALSAREKAGSVRVVGGDLPQVDRVDAALIATASVLLPASPAVVFVGLGFPKQEELAVGLLAERPDLVFVGSGASAEMLNGEHRRSPDWMQQAGLEWLWRLGHEPRRLARRYLAEGVPWLVAALVGAAVHRMRGRGDDDVAR